MLFKLPGAQLREVNTAGTTGAVKVRLALCVPPFSEAVSVAVSLVGTLITVATNCALPWPARTVTETGATTFALPLDNTTTVFEAAADTSVTVHVAFPAALKLLGAQLNPDRPAGATRLTCAVLVTPFKLAVTVAVWLDAITPAVTVKLALLAPTPIVTLPGVVSCALSSESVTVEALTAALSNTTVHVAP